MEKVWSGIRRKVLEWQGFVNPDWENSLLNRKRVCIMKLNRICGIQEKLCLAKMAKKEYMEE